MCNGSGFSAWLQSMRVAGFVFLRSAFQYPQIVNASTLRFRLVVWTPITQPIDRPGWFGPTSCEQ